MAQNGNYRKKFFYKKNQKVRKKPPSDVSTIDIEPTHGYYYFKVYFPEEDTIDAENLIPQLKICKEYITENIKRFDLNIIQENRCFELDYEHLKIENCITKNWPDFHTELINNTDNLLLIFGLAMHQVLCEDFASKIPEIDEETFLTFQKKIGKIIPKIVNFGPMSQLKDFNVNAYGKLLVVRGSVIRSSGIKNQCEYLAFSCSSCGGEQIVKQRNFQFTLPTKCLSTGCQARSNFLPLVSSPYSQAISCQTIKMQELAGDDQYENGRTPRTVECEFFDTLVNSCMPGDDVTITGVTKMKDNSATTKSNLFSMYLKGVSVINNKDRSQATSERIKFCTEDFYEIQKIHEEENLFRYLVQSLCPSIFGHEIVKAGLLLALFGGNNKNGSRSESHVMMIGDPGLGKSQMLQACTNVAPKGVYVCGNTSTSSGLTVTLSRESGGKYALEAGALMMADQGCCCIDEFDKMPTQHSALLEAMEQQSISIAKAGITCTLPSRTTILAAANPSGGHYNKAKTITENLKISAPMLSRFDLIFILIDNPDEERDMMVSKHILGRHSFNRSSTSSTTNSFTSNDSVMDEGSLRFKLQISQCENFEFLSHDLLRKYIAYARKYVNPSLSEPAKRLIQSFYMELRKNFKTGDSTPVTTRQLQSLIRLSQARAKVELREEVTKEDAQDVIEIMKRSLYDIFTNEAGVLDTTRAANSTGMSQRGKAMKLFKDLQQLANSQSKSIFSMREIKNLGEKLGIPSEKIPSIVQNLNLQGLLLNKGYNNYQLSTV